MVQGIGVLPVETNSPLWGAITRCPDQALALRLLRQRLPRLLKRARVLTGELIRASLSHDSLDDVVHQANEWLDDEQDPMLAIAAASISSALLTQPMDAMPLWQRCLAYPDEAVRKAALEHVDQDGLTDEQRDAIRALREAHREPYHCTRCGSPNPAATACETCHQQAPETINRIGELLDGPKPVTPVDLRRLFPRRLSHSKLKPLVRI